MSWARPTDLAVDPAPLASINQPARTPRPTVAPADEIADGLRRRGGLRRGAKGRAGRDLPREPAFDLLEREPDRAAVLLGIPPSRVAQAPYPPSATRVTERSQCGALGALRCRNDDIPGRDVHPHLQQGALRC